MNQRATCRVKTKLLEKNIRVNIHGLEFGMNSETPKAWALTKKNKLDFIKINNSCAARHYRDSEKTSHRRGKKNCKSDLIRDLLPEERTFMISIKKLTLRRAKKYLDWHFPEDCRQTANKHMKRYSLSVIRERQTKTPVPFHIQEDDCESHRSAGRILRNQNPHTQL